MSEILRLENVSYTYSPNTPFRVEALKHIDLGFEKGCITGVIGHTGSGKSTLVQMLNGLIRPTEGKIYLDGRDIWEEPKKIRDVRFRVGLVMQYPEYQLFDETIASDIGYALRNMQLPSEEMEKRIAYATDFVGLPKDILKKSPFEVSGGQKRRVAIAGVLAMLPEVLVLDEPAAGLDPRGRREILGKLKAYRDTHQAAVILVSHSMEDMAEYCDRIVVMNHSEVWREGTVREIFSYAEEIAQMGLDIPQIARIAAILQKRGWNLQGDLYTVEGMKQAILSLIGGGTHAE